MSKISQTKVKNTFMVRHCLENKLPPAISVKTGGSANSLQ